MTIQLEINEYNKMCAFFLGYTVTEKNGRFEVRDSKNVLCRSVSCLLKETKEETYKLVLEWELSGTWYGFYKDWNMIMLVIDKIESLGYIFDIHCSHPPSDIIIKWYSIRIMKNNLENIINRTWYVKYDSDIEKQESRKESVVKAINQFLTKYYAY